MAQRRQNPAILLDLMLAGSIAVVVLAGRAVPISRVTVFGASSSLSLSALHSACVAACQNGDLGIFVPLFMAGRALFVLYAGLQHSCILINNPLPGVVQYGLLCIGGVIAARAGHIGIPADFGAGGCLCLVSNFVMAQGGLLCIGGVVAARAGYVGIPADFGTSGCLCLVGNFVMAQGGLLHVGAAVAARAAHISIPADFRASGILCLVGNFVMTQGGLLCVGGVIAARAGHIGSPADFGTSGCLAFMVNFVMTQGGLLCIGGVIAARAGYISIPADLGAGRCLASMGDFIMAQGRNFHIGGVIAARAGYMGLPADLSTGGILCLMGHFVMAQSGYGSIGVSMAGVILTGVSGETIFSTNRCSHHSFVIMTQRGDLLSVGILTAVTGDGLETLRLAGSRGVHRLKEGVRCIGMLTSPHAVHRLVNDFTGIASGFYVSAVRILQLGRGNRNTDPLICLIIRTSVLYLVGLSLRARLHDNGAGTADTCTAGSGVYKTGRSIYRAVHFHISIIGSANYILSRIRILQVNMGSIRSTTEGRAFLNSIRCNFCSPLIVVVDIDFVAAAQSTSRTLCDNQLCAGLEGNILRHGNGTAAVHGNSHVAVDGQNIVLGVNSLATKHTQLHAQAQALNRNITHHIDHQSAGSLVIILDDMPAGNIEHTVGANKGNSTALNTGQRNTNGHITIFCCASFQSHGHFHILHIVLGHGENSLLISNHARGVVAAAPVHNLEALVYGTAVLDGNRAAALNVTPGIQFTAVIDGNAAARFHLDEAAGTNRTTLTAAGFLCSRKAQRTVNHNVRTIGHGQLAVDSRCRIGVIICSCRCSGAQGIGIIIRDQQSDAAGDGVVTCRQSAVVSQHNGLVGNRRNSFHCGSQAFIQAVTIDQEPSSIFSKNCLNTHIVGRLQNKGSSLRQNLMRLRINPAQEGCTVLGGRNQLHTRTGDIQLGISRHSFACYSNATQIAIVLESHHGRFLCCHTSKVTHHQFVGGAVLCSGDGNDKVLSSIQNLAKAAGGTAIHRAINLQLVDRSSSPVKGNIGLAAAFVIHSNSGSLCAGTKTQNAAATLSSNGNSTTGHGVIGSAGNTNSHTGNRSMVAGSCLDQRIFSLKNSGKADKGLYIGIGQYVLFLSLRDILCHCLDLGDLGNSRLLDGPGLCRNGLLDLQICHFRSHSVGLQNGIDPGYQFLCQSRGLCRRFGNLRLSNLRFRRRCFRHDDFFMIMAIIFRCKCLERHSGENHNERQE